MQQLRGSTWLEWPSIIALMAVASAMGNPKYVHDADGSYLIS